MKNKKTTETNETKHLRTVKDLNEQGHHESSPGNNIFKKDTDGTLTRPCVVALCECMKSVGILYIGQHGRGTVVRVGCNYIITAWHIVEGILFPACRDSTLPDITCLQKDNITVDFGDDRYQATEKFKLLPNIVFKDADLDIVILVLDTAEKKNNLPQPFQWIWLRLVGILSTSMLVIGQHPSETCIVIDSECKKICLDDEKVVKAKKWFKTNKEKLKLCRKRKGLDTNSVDSSLFEINDERKVIIDTFLGKGASGGAIVGKSSDQTLGLVAILTHGIPPPYYDETDLKIPQELCMEVGTTMKAIKHAMEVQCVDHQIINSIFPSSHT
ncbi:uncharacterized protein LOC128553051 [Mercenaria mercenaria]|uniref:uncharacterized protein LOC128553051 n=1 Tax=Mercenaria mercenaria TaxID=6596 RepID=UPI00234F40D8|nr:uncharacterized protein LOC128553051 [Mercenaria mercenaria]